MQLRLQHSPDFELVRNSLLAAGFNEQSVCNRLGVAALSELLSDRQTNATSLQEGDQLSFLVRLLLLGDSIEKAELESALSAPLVQALENLGLASPGPANGSSLRCPFVLYPIHGVFTVSDRWTITNGGLMEPPVDFVFPAMTPALLAGLPSTPCGHFLELCAGAGTVALLASRYSHHAWATDITERSAQTAEFNRLLNGIDNVTTLQADCYNGLGDLQFDRIVAHPPYMPVVQPAQIFYDGGQDGEQVTRRIVEGLPRHLRPGGCFYCLAQGSDRKDAPLEYRLRGWLGESHGDFDVAVIERLALLPEDAARIYAIKSKGGHEALNQMREALTKLGIESLSYCWMVIQRKDNTREVFTLRRSAGPQTGPEQIAWLLRWETFLLNASAFEKLLEMAPLARPSLALHSTHRLLDGEFVPARLAFHADDPFAMDCRVAPWQASLAPLCNGQATVRQLWETCKARNFIHPQTPPLEFAKLIGVMISGGFLEVADYRPPDPHTGVRPAAGIPDQTPG